ncbi:MAG: hypothetical protein MOGMAGMI_01833 [Candidatus Omnitrophica bacterium]|nr:hypothetical protein [Candidatus Omnitrophota bacterium]
MTTWIDLKRKLDDMDGTVISMQVDRLMHDAPEKVTTKMGEGGEFYETQELDGEYDIFYRIHKPKEKQTTVEIMAFDNKSGVGYYRKIKDVF